ncbi:MAG: CZB domain-containing protein [Candidatus Kapaibacteriota bacterium]
MVLLLVAVALAGVTIWLQITILNVEEIVTKTIELPKLQDQLGSLTIQHYEWAEALAAGTILQGKEFTKALDPRKCALGRWYYSYKPPEKFAETYKKIEEPHRRFHSTAEKIIAAINRGDTQLALEIYNQETTPYLAQTRDALTEFRLVVSKHVSKNFEEILKNLKSFRSQIIVMFVILLIIITLYSTFFVIRPIISSIKKVINVANSVAKGDFSAFK